MRKLLAVLALALACGGYIPEDHELPPSPHVQRFWSVYLVTNHLDWWLDPFHRTEDNETYPKIVVVSSRSQACVLTPEDKGYGQWASALRDDPVNCPRPWRSARHVR